MGWFFSEDNSDKDANKNVANQPNQNFEITENIQSYSSSRTCYTDPEDEKFMICKEKRISNGKEEVNETRVPASQYQFGMPSIFSTFFQGLD